MWKDDICRKSDRPGRSDIGEDLIRANSATKHTSPQEIISSKHRSAISDFTEGYFKTIYKLYSGQRVTGFKQVVMRKNWNQNQIQSQENPRLLRKFTETFKIL